MWLSNPRCTTLHVWHTGHLQYTILWHCRWLWLDIILSHSIFKYGIYISRFRSVEVITLASHARGPGFDPQRNHILFVFILMYCTGKCATDVPFYDCATLVLWQCVPQICNQLVCHTHDQLVCNRCAQLVITHTYGKTVLLPWPQCLLVYGK